VFVQERGCSEGVEPAQSWESPALQGWWGLMGSEVPIGAGIAVVYAKKFHQALLDPSCKRLHSNVGDVALEVIIDTICWNIWEVLEMWTLGRSYSCWTRL
jgi:hypothetical protein